MAKLNNKKLQTQRNFQSIWHSQPEYVGKLLREDQLIREYILGTMKSNGWKLSEIMIKRKVKQIHIAFQIQNKIIKERKRWTKNRLKNRMKYSSRASRLGRLTSNSVNGIGSQKRIKRIKEVSHKKRFLYFQLLLMITELRKMYPNNQISFYIQKVKPLQLNARLIDAWIIANIKKKKSHKRLLNRIIWKYRKGVEKTKPIAKQDGAVLIVGTRNKTIDSTWSLLKKEDKKNFLSWITGNLIYLYNVHKLGLTDLLNGTNSSSLSTTTALQNRAVVPLRGAKTVSRVSHKESVVKGDALTAGRSSRKANSTSFQGNPEQGISSFNSFWFKWKIGANRGSMTRSNTAGRNRIMGPRSGAKMSPKAAKGLSEHISQYTLPGIPRAGYNLTAQQNRAVPLRGPGYKKRLKGKLPGGTPHKGVLSTLQDRKDAFGTAKRNFHIPSKGNPEQSLVGLRNENHLSEGFNSLNLSQINSIFPSKGALSRVSSTRPIKHSRSAEIHLPEFIPFQGNPEQGILRKEALNIARRNRAGSTPPLKGGVTRGGYYSQELAIKLYYLIRLKYLTFAPQNRGVPLHGLEGLIGNPVVATTRQSQTIPCSDNHSVISRSAGNPWGIIHQDLRSTWRLTRKIPRIQIRLGNIRRHLWKQHRNEFNEDTLSLLNYYKLNYVLARIASTSPQALNVHSMDIPGGNALEIADKHNTFNLANTSSGQSSACPFGPRETPEGFLWQGKKFVNFFQLHPPLLDHLIKCLIAIPMFTAKSSEGSLVSFLTHFWIGFFDYIYHYENSLSKWQGIRILLSGRVGFRKMGRAKKYSSFWGVCKNSSARLPLQYSYSQIHTRYGIIGMKIFLR